MKRKSLAIYIQVYYYYAQVYFYPTSTRYVASCCELLMIEKPIYTTLLRTSLRVLQGWILEVIVVIITGVQRRKTI